MTAFSDHLVQANRATWTAMAAHPFVLGLADGTLPDESLRAWVQQDRVFVLQVGRVDRPLQPPRKPWEVARVSFEIARRHRFHREMAALPDHVTAHVLPTGGGTPKDDSLLSYRDFRGVVRRIDAAYRASAAYLDRSLCAACSAAWCSHRRSSCSPSCC